MHTTLGSAARALVAVTLVALAADALLGALTGVLGSVGGSPGAPWWVTGHVLERGRWAVFALLLVAAAHADVLVDAADGSWSATATWRVVGILAITTPLLWILAQWLVQATLFTVADRWAIDGQVFRSADYYRQLFAGYVPWLLGGATAIAGSRHVG